MTGAQAFTLIGGVCQIVALVWAWVAVYRFWVSRWSDTPVFPRLARAWEWTIGTWRRFVRWILRRPPVHGTIHAVSGVAVGTVTLSGEAIASDGTVEGRLAALEQITRRQYEKQAEQIADLRQTVDSEVSALHDQHREARESSEASEQGAARFSLGGTALFAILGTGLQIVAAFV